MAASRDWLHAHACQKPWAARVCWCVRAHFLFACTLLFLPCFMSLHLACRPLRSHPQIRRSASTFGISFGQTIDEFVVCVKNVMHCWLSSVCPLHDKRYGNVYIGHPKMQNLSIMKLHRQGFFLCTFHAVTVTVMGLVGVRCAAS